MKNIRRILALAGVALLLLMYILTMVFAIRKDPNARGLFFASIAMTVFVPILLYAFQLAAKMVRPTKSPVIDAIVFDLGGVIIDFPWKEHLAGLHLSEEGEAFVRDHIAGGPLWRSLDRGTRTREEVIAECAAMAPHLEEDIRKYLSTIYDCLNPMPYTMDWLTSLKNAGYKLYVITDWPIGAREEMLERGALPFYDMLDGGIWSSDVHLLKPEKEIFELLIDKYHLTPSRAVFLDDHIENVEAARECGLAAFPFTGYPEAVQTLADLGVKGR